MIVRSAVIAPEIFARSAASETRLIAQPAEAGNWITLSRDAGFIAIGSALLAANALLGADIEIPWLTPLLGFGAVVGIPAFFIYLAGIGHTDDASERVATGVVLAIGLVMMTGLAINTMLPYLGVSAPLAEAPVVLAVDTLCLVLGIWAYFRHPSSFVISLPSPSGRDVVAGGLGLVVLGLAVLGAVRLNNGAGGGLTLAALALAAWVLALLMLWQSRLRSGTIPLVIYSLSLALLLMTSLRGWYTTGHDIQSEFRVFQLTKGGGLWDMSLLRDAYNACLSVTILPTILSRWTRVADPYIYKVFFQVLFALSPVLVYRLAYRITDGGKDSPRHPPLSSDGGKDSPRHPPKDSVGFPALIATIFFVSFVTFFQDMPMLNRQEIAFLFLLGGLMALFNERLPLRHRQIWFGVFAVGMVVSHYSTTYVTIGVLTLAWAVRVLARPVCRTLRVVTPRIGSRVAWLTESRNTYAIGLGTIAFVSLIAFLWSTPITRTESQLSKTVQDLATSIRGGAGAEEKSSDIAYSIFGPPKASPAARLAAYKKANLELTAEGRASGEYYDMETLSKYSTPLVAKEKIPLTQLGKSLSRLGLNVASFNKNVREGSAVLLQVLIIVGMVSVVFARRKMVRPKPEFFFLAVGTLTVVLLQIALPVLSVEYGLLRAFQQSLIVLALFLAAGSLALVPGAMHRRRKIAAGTLALAFFVSSTGIMMQVLGGYPAQLHLNNAGPYYDIYHLHSEEIASLKWLERHASAPVPGGVQAQVQTDRYTKSKNPTLTRLDVHGDIYPDMIRRGAYVFLGYATVRKGTSTVSFSGDQVTYRYPIGFLDDQKDLIYHSRGARVYR